MPTKIGGIKIFTLKEINKQLGVTTITLRQYIKHGKLRGQKWYVSEESLRDFFEGNEGNNVAGTKQT